MMPPRRIHVSHETRLSAQVLVALSDVIAMNLTYKDRPFSPRLSFQQKKSAFTLEKSLPVLICHREKMHFTSISPSTFVALALSLLPGTQSAPFIKSSGSWLALDTDFPDPSFVHTPENKWYAFGTEGNGKRIQVAESDDFTTWTRLDIEGLPNVAAWEEDFAHFAPDVIQRVSSNHLFHDVEKSSC